MWDNGEIDRDSRGHNNLALAVRHPSDPKSERADPPLRLDKPTEDKRDDDHPEKIHR